MIKTIFYNLWNKPENRYPIMIATLALIFGVCCTAGSLIAILISTAALYLFTYLGTKAVEVVLGTIHSTQELINEAKKIVKSARKNTLAEVTATVADIRKDTVPAINQTILQGNQAAAEVTTMVADVRTNTVPEINQTIQKGGRVASELTATVAKVRKQTLPEVNETIISSRRTAENAEKTSEAFINNASTVLAPITGMVSLIRKGKSYFVSEGSPENNSDSECVSDSEYESDSDETKVKEKTHRPN